MEIFLNQKLKALLDEEWQMRRVLFFSAPCGFGKSAAADSLLTNMAVLRIDLLNGKVPDDIPPCDAVLIDNLQELYDGDAQQALCSAIREHAQMKFALLSRGPVPGWLMPFQLTGVMLVVDEKLLLLDYPAAQQLLKAHGVELSRTETEDAWKRTEGYPLALTLLAQHLKADEPFCEKTMEMVSRELFLYYQEAVYFRFGPQIRRLLLSLAPFERFNAELARFVSGDDGAGGLLETLLQRTKMLRYDSADSWHFWPIFRKFLLWQQEQELSPEEILALQRSAALYYELHGDYTAALSCYAKAGAHSKVSRILVKNSELHPGLAHFEEMEPYYRALPREEVLSSPVLMCGMSMLDALVQNYEESEKWYHELEMYAERQKKISSAYREARGWISYLDVTLPQRTSADLIDTIKNIAVLLTDRSITIPAFSVTSMLPSVMNGGKDFCSWSKRDDFLYATMRLPLEKLLGRDGIGLADCAITESKLEKGENVSDRISHLYSILNKVQRKGTPDMEFVVVGLAARWAVIQGRSEDALEDLDRLRKSFEDRGEDRLLPNLDAMLCRIAMCRGDTLEVERWYRDRAPKERLNFRGMRRYQYLTQAMAELAWDDLDGAARTLEPLENYFIACARVMDGIHLDILRAIGHYRGGKDWKTPFARAISTCEEYGFIRPVADYGGAVLPLLTAADWLEEGDFLKQLLSKTRAQAALYPQFLKWEAGILEPLSPMERNVLRMICSDKSNAEIAQTMGIAVSTVKTHVSNILRKLGVSRRSEAKTAARRLHLI